MFGKPTIQKNVKIEAIKIIAYLLKSKFFKKIVIASFENWKYKIVTNTKPPIQAPLFDALKPKIPKINIIPIITTIPKPIFSIKLPIADEICIEDTVRKPKISEIIK